MDNAIRTAVHHAEPLHKQACGLWLSESGTVVRTRVSDSLPTQELVVVRAIRERSKEKEWIRADSKRKMRWDTVKDRKEEPWGQKAEPGLCTKDHHFSLLMTRHFRNGWCQPGLSTNPSSLPNKTPRQNLSLLASLYLIETQKSSVMWHCSLLVSLMRYRTALSYWNKGTDSSLMCAENHCVESLTWKGGWGRRNQKASFIVPVYIYH